MNQQVSDTIVAKSRVAAKKGVSRKLRETGLVPAVAYGPSSAPRSLSIDPRTFFTQRQTFGASHVFTVQVEGADAFKALVKDIQRHPVSRAILHVDLYELDMNRPIRVSVPLELVGKPAGVVDGGLLQQQLRLVEVVCLPGLIPEKLQADVSPLKVGDSLHLSDIALPEGVKFSSLHNEAVAVLAEPEEVKEATPAAAAAAPAAAAAKAEDKKK
jgi:large subunit ribosomal protein L25